MIRAYWNALRVDDNVVVHDDLDRGFALSTGTVAFVDSHVGSNEVTVRLTDESGVTRLVRPKRLAVHLEDHDSRADCWRCGLRQAKPSLGR